MRNQVIWDSGVVPAGAVINSPVLDVSAYEGVSIYADNTGGDAIRTIAGTVLADDGTTTLKGLGPTVAIGGRGILNFGPKATAFNVDASLSSLGPKLRASFGAGGTGPARLIIVGQG